MTNFQLKRVSIDELKVGDFIYDLEDDKAKEVIKYQKEEDSFSIGSFNYDIQFKDEDGETKEIYIEDGKKTSFLRIFQLSLKSQKFVTGRRDNKF